MSGTNPVATWSLPNNAVDLASTYKAKIDGDAAVAQRVVDNFAPHQAASPNMTVVVDAGSIFTGTTLTEVAQQTTGAITAPTGSNKRIDRIVIDASTGVVSVITGTPTAGTPSAPAITAGKLPVAQTGQMTSSTTTITNSMLIDERNFWGFPTTGVTAGSYTYSNITIDAEGRVLNASSNTVPIATSSTAGLVIPDGTVITVDGSGHITVPDATSGAFGVVKVDGTTITASGGVITSVAGSSNVQTFSSSGTWSKPAGIGTNSVSHIECIGGGGGSGGGGNPGLSAGAGGGSYKSLWVLTSSLSATETVTVGAGGSAGGVNGNGGAGGASSLGSHITAYGGSASTNGGTNAGAAAGGYAATASAGSASNDGGGDGFGGNGTKGVAGYYTGGGGGDANNAGGASVYGGGGGSGNTGGAGGVSQYAGNGGASATAGTAPGGGAGGVTNNVGGKAGAAGQVKVTTYSFN